jgi:exopolyphosphatase/guanosine-5'-triphosphate,3'-diphosphate pyrophosphatase
VLLHRGRSSKPLPDVSLRAKSRSLELQFPAGWLEDHPLTLADLEAEADYLKAIGFRLKFG